MEEKKATKLKKLKLTSVDMVRRGANQDAHINLYKSAEEPAGKDLMQTIVDAVKSALGFEVEKKADTFEEKMQLREVQDNRWKYVDALNMSIDSILADQDLSTEEKEDMIVKSIEQFANTYADMCEKLIAAYDSQNGPRELAKAADEEELEEEEETPVEEPEEPTDEGELEEEEEPIEEEPVEEEEEEPEEDEEEGDQEMKRVDKSRFTPEELQQYEALIAKGMVEEKDPAPAAAEGVNKSGNEEIMKALEDARKEVAEVKKAAEMKELTDVAKKYAVLGKKEDELANQLYVMKSTSPEAYESYIALLDESLGYVEKSGMFEEVGKSSHNIPGGNVEAKIDSIATEIQKAAPDMNRTQAIAKAWEQHPELIAEYEKEYRK